MHARALRAAVLSAIALAAVSLVAAAPAAAGTDLTPPTAVDSSATTHSVELRWQPPFDRGLRLTGFVLTRTGGPDAVGNVAVSARVGTGVRSYVFDDLVPGLRYRVGVAAVYRSEVGPPAIRVVGPDTSEAPQLISSVMSAKSAVVRRARAWDDLHCGSGDPRTQCGYVYASFRSEGYTASTVTGVWDLAATVTRTFGCTDATGTVTGQATITHRDDLGDTDGQVFLDAGGRSVNSGQHSYYRTGVYESEFPRAACPVGSFVTQTAVHVEAVTASLLGDYLPDFTSRRLLAVIRLPGYADDPPVG